jgi:hypothetical protein
MFALAVISYSLLMASAIDCRFLTGDVRYFALGTD